MKILVAGATGLVGKKLVEVLLANHHQVNYLTTRKSAITTLENCKGFYWNPNNKEIDPNCIVGVDKIINLAGASIAKRWTKAYKKEILASRVDSCATLYQLLQTNTHKVTHIISASAIGVYKHSFTKLYKEDSNCLGTGFLATVVQQWEAAIDNFKDINIPVSKVRIGLVLAGANSALQQLQTPIKYGCGTVLVTGNQYVSWIHITDLTKLLHHILLNDNYGVYNAVAPNPTRNKTLTKQIAQQLNRPLFLPNAPKFFLKLLLGEMHHLLCDSQKVSSEKIQSAGFQFRYKHINDALTDLL